MNHNIVALNKIHDKVKELILTFNATSLLVIIFLVQKGCTLGYLFAKQNIKDIHSFDLTVRSMSVLHFDSLMNTSTTTEENLNEFGRFDELKATSDRKKSKAYFGALEGQTIQTFRMNIKASNLLRDFVIRGGFALD